MRVVALLASLSLAGSATAAQAPVRVDLIVYGDIVDEDFWSILPEAEDGSFYVDPPMGFDSKVRVERTVRGRAPGAFVQVVSIRKSNLRTYPSIYWLKRRDDGRFDQVCARAWFVDSRLHPSADQMPEIPKDWCRMTPCDR